MTEHEKEVAMQEMQRAFGEIAERLGLESGDMGPEEYEALLEAIKENYFIKGVNNNKK